ncbi:uncharacterized protein I303_103236 [Kwoniella dejecticola CBS 10117]|uniref:Uncharacterized protein n=1 Tax=Kwoniella dejecticola CBS 10117 TaxID=1296121 RepID=A0A1A6AB05_9TREE|nr:uncharacterized protein I303_03259 [Kwoniella dejecticola CBS 10117]OBR87234.1 hypothetical protein I303_03259 [Kwoniella dejecticola CBS 10117]
MAQRMSYADLADLLRQRQGTTGIRSSAAPFFGTQSAGTPLSFTYRHPYTGASGVPSSSIFSGGRPLYTGTGSTTGAQPPNLASSFLGGGGGIPYFPPQFQQNPVLSPNTFASSQQPVQNVFQGKNGPILWTEIGPNPSPSPHPSLNAFDRTQNSNSTQNNVRYWNTRLGQTQTTRAGAFKSYLTKLGEDTARSMKYSEAVMGKLRSVAQSRGTSQGLVDQFQKEQANLTSAQTTLRNIEITKRQMMSGKLSKEEAGRRYSTWGTVVFETPQGLKRSDWDNHMASENGNYMPLNAHFKRMRDIAASQTQIQGRAGQQAGYTQGQPYSDLSDSWSRPASSFGPSNSACSNQPGGMRGTSIPANFARRASF